MLYIPADPELYLPQVNNMTFMRDWSAHQVVANFPVAIRSFSANEHFGCHRQKFYHSCIREA